MAPRKRKREPRPVDPPSDSPDLISALPNEVLAAVLSFLPLKESVRTGILSSRWRHLWPLSSLNIDDSSLVRMLPSSDGDFRASYQYRDSRSREIVCRIVSSHGGSFRSCRLSLFKQREFYSTVDGFIETLTQRGIEELDLRFYSDDYQLPSSIAFCKSLSKLRIMHCRFFEPPFPPTSFQNLKDLQIDGGKLSEETIHCLLASCLCLENLHLFAHCDASLLQFSSPTLRKLWLEFYNGWVKGITIADTPNLKQLMLGETVANCNSFIVQNAPRLELLGFMALESRLLQLGNSTFCRQPPRRISEHCEIMRPMLINISSVLPSVKTLAIRVMFGGDTKEVLPSFLRCFPCLESLNLLLVGRIPVEDDIHWEKLAPFDFIKELKTVTIKNFGKYNCDADLARFLVLKGRRLKKMTLLCSQRLTKKWIGTMSRCLCLDYKASSELEVNFLKDCYDNINFVVEQADKSIEDW